MAEQKKVVFTVADADAEERLIREYVAPAFGRIDGRDDAQWPIFNRYAQDPSVENGEVVLLFFGDVEAVVADERPRWDELVSNDLLLEWRTVDTDARLADLDELDRFRYRLRNAASRMSLETFAAFEPLPDSMDEFADEEYQVGWGLCLHHVVNQLGYQANGGEEEIDLLFQGVVSRLYAMAMASGYGPEAAETKIEELTTELESLPAELRELHEKRRNR